MSRKKNISKSYAIDKAVQDSINNFLASIERTNDVSPRIDGEIPDVSKYIRTFSNINSFNDADSTVNEGLIRTYPIEPFTL